MSIIKYSYSCTYRPKAVTWSSKEWAEGNRLLLAGTLVEVCRLLHRHAGTARRLCRADVLTAQFPWQQPLLLSCFPRAPHALVGS